MRELLSPADIATTISMLRDSFRGAVLMVEGSTDSLLLEKYADYEVCRTIVCHGKDNVIGALQILDERKIRGTLAVIDADFLRVAMDLGSQSSLPDLFLTDSHDMETMMLQSPALDIVLKELGSPFKLQLFVERSGKQVRDALLQAARPVAFLRLLSLSEKLNLKFPALDFGKFVDSLSLRADLTKLIRAVKNNSQRPDLSEDDTTQKISLLASLDRDNWQLCNGHDMVCVLSHGLQKALGTHDSKKVSPETLESNLRMAYDFTYFMMTDLCKSIREWELRTGYRVLRDVVVDRGTEKLA